MNPYIPLVSTLIGVVIGFFLNRYSAKRNRYEDVTLKERHATFKEFGGALFPLDDAVKALRKEGLEKSEGKLINNVVSKRVKLIKAVTEQYVAVLALRPYVGYLMEDERPLYDELQREMEAFVECHDYHETSLEYAQRIKGTVRHQPRGSEEMVRGQQEYLKLVPVLTELDTRAAHLQSLTRRLLNQQHSGLMSSDARLSARLRRMLRLTSHALPAPPFAELYDPPLQALPESPPQPEPQGEEQPPAPMPPVDSPQPVAQTQERTPPTE